MEEFNKTVDKIVEEIKEESLININPSSISADLMDLYAVLGIRDFSVSQEKVKVHADVIRRILDKCTDKKNNSIDKKLLIESLVKFYTIAYYREYNSIVEDEKVKTIFMKEQEYDPDITDKVKLSVCASLRELTKSNTQKSLVADHNNIEKVNTNVAPDIIAQRLLYACSTLAAIVDPEKEDSEEIAKKLKTDYDARRNQAIEYEHMDVINMVEKVKAPRHKLVMPEEDFIIYDVKESELIPVGRENISKLK